MRAEIAQIASEGGRFASPRVPPDLELLAGGADFRHAAPAGRRSVFRSRNSAIPFRLAAFAVRQNAVAGRKANAPVRLAVVAGSQGTIPFPSATAPFPPAASAGRTGASAGRTGVIAGLPKVAAGSSAETACRKGAVASRLNIAERFDVTTRQIWCDRPLVV